MHTADTLGAAAKLLDSDPHETLVVIGPRAATGDALAFSAALRLARPAVGVILTRREMDITLLTRALQSGVREVVPAGDHGALTAACRRSCEVSRRMLAPLADDAMASTRPDHHRVRRQGRLREDHAGDQPRRGAGQGTGRRVCVVDLDLAFGDVAISVQLDPVRTSWTRCRWPATWTSRRCARC